MFSKPDDWFFPGYNDQPMTIGNVERNHRRFLWKARISHAGRSKIPGQTGGPRVHDYRHTFAVHCLKRWVLEGKDLRAYIPVLQAYLGHVCFSDTAYYLHLTTDLFPNITEQVQYALGDIIPKAGDFDENH
jgi:integrase